MNKISDESINFIEKTVATLREEVTIGGRILAEAKIQGRHIPGRCTITITICNSDDATQPHV